MSKINTAFILSAIYKNQSLSINEIASKSGKSISLVTKIVFECIEKGIVKESGIAESSGGRKPTLYQLKPDKGYVVVMAMDQYITRVMVLDLANNLLGEPILVNIDLARDETALSKVSDLLHKTITGSQLPKDKLLGIGIAMPGFVDFIKGINYSYLQSPVKDITLKDYLSKDLGLPVYIDNDSSVIALAEAIFGRANDTPNAMVVNISWGIGLGIVTNGKLYRGENGFAGEFSHIPLFNNNKICSCGKIGCLETETSFKIILEKAMDAIKEGRPTILKNTLNSMDNLEEQFLKFIQAVEKRDMLAIELLNEAAYNIGKGIAVLIHIFNPKRIVLSGRGAMAGNVWLPPIQQAINEHCIRRLAENVEVVVSDLGIQAEWIGAAALVVENVLCFDK